MLDYSVEGQCSVRLLNVASFLLYIVSGSGYIASQNKVLSVVSKPIFHSLSNVRASSTIFPKL